VKRKRTNKNLPADVTVTARHTVTVDLAATGELPVLRNLRPGETVTLSGPRAQRRADRVAASDRAAASARLP
jgi:hypothetical protein